LATKRKSKTRKVKPKSRKAKAKPRRKVTKTKSRKSSPKKKKAFGGYSIKFAGRKETLEQVFGKTPIAPSQMTKKIWTFVKAKRLGNKD